MQVSLAEPMPCDDAGRPLCPSCWDSDPGQLLRCRHCGLPHASSEYAPASPGVLRCPDLTEEQRRTLTVPWLDAG